MDRDTSVAVESLLQISRTYSPSVSSASSPDGAVSPLPSPTESLCTDNEDERLQPASSNKVRTRLLWGVTHRDALWLLSATTPAHPPSAVVTVTANVAAAPPDAANGPRPPLCAGPHPGLHPHLPPALGPTRTVLSTSAGQPTWSCSAFTNRTAKISCSGHSRGGGVRSTPPLSLPLPGLQ